jgi:hypothetical protein
VRVREIYNPVPPAEEKKKKKNMSIAQRLTAAFRTNPTERVHLLTSTAGGCIQQTPVCLSTGEEEGGLRASTPHVTDDELRHLKDFTTTTSEPLASQEAASACTAENLCSSRVWLYGDRQTWQDWGISLWSEFLGTFLMVFVGTPPPLPPSLSPSSFLFSLSAFLFFFVLFLAWCWAYARH